VFELSQTLRQNWLTADYSEKRRILEIIWLNCRLDGATLVPTMRKPFDVLAEGLLLKKVEAAGIEPASRDISMWASTCVVGQFTLFALATPLDRVLLGLAGNVF
jgi:hypothetical protein